MNLPAVPMDLNPLLENTMLTFDESNIVAIANSDKDIGIYALYGNSQLFLADVRTQEMKLVAKLPNLHPAAH